jgi:hypothetical protein
LPEDLRSDGTANLPVAVDEADAKGGSCGAGRRLDTPGPHEREEGGGECVADQRGCVHGSVGRVDDQYAIAGHDHSKHTQRIHWSGQLPIVRKEARDAYDEQRKHRDWEVEQLSPRDGSEAQIGNDGRLVEAYTRGADGKGGPDEGEEPETDVFEGVDDFAEVEVLFRSSRRVGREAGLDESFLLVCEPFGIRRNCVVFKLVFCRSTLEMGIVNGDGLTVWKNEHHCHA